METPEDLPGNHDALALPQSKYLSKQHGSKKPFYQTGLVKMSDVFTDENGISHRRTIFLASQDRAMSERSANPKALSIDMTTGSLEDTESGIKPEQLNDLARLIIAHAARVGQDERDVIINCSSGKTRTPSVMIAYLLLKKGGKVGVADLRAAYREVGQAFVNDRPNVVIDSNANLSRGKKPVKSSVKSSVKSADDIVAHIEDSPTWKDVLNYINENVGAEPRGVVQWKQIETKVESVSVAKKNRLLKQWRRFKKLPKPTDSRLTESTVSSALETQTLSSQSSRQRSPQRLSVETQPMETQPSAMENPSRARTRTPARTSIARSITTRSMAHTAKKTNTLRKRKSEEQNLEEIQMSNWWKKTKLSDPSDLQKPFKRTKQKARSTPTMKLRTLKPVSADMDGSV